MLISKYTISLTPFLASATVLLAQPPISQLPSLRDMPPRELGSCEWGSCEWGSSLLCQPDKSPRFRDPDKITTLESAETNIPVTEEQSLKTRVDLVELRERGRSETLVFMEYQHPDPSLRSERQRYDVFRYLQLIPENYGVSEVTVSACPGTKAACEWPRFVNYTQSDWVWVRE